LGSGDVRAEGWVGLDLTTTCDVVGEAQRLPFRDQAFDGCFANHSLCAMTWHQLPGIVAEVRRVLEPGAVFRVSVPDVVRAFEAFKRGDPEWFPIGAECPTLGEKLAAYLTWFSTNRTCFTVESLRALLMRSFEEAWDQPPWLSVDSTLTELDDRIGESLFVEAW
jgi:SAM-dependent methyltransferase